MHTLFNDAGLLWIDAANPKLRQMESAYFMRLIEAAPEIAQQVTVQEQSLNEAGYGTPIYADQQAANLFYVKDGARHLLTRQANHFVAGEYNSLKRNTGISQQHPQQLSNNV